MAEPAALILDMDGVIVDSEPLHKEADRRIFREIGLDVPVEVLQEYAGTGADVFYRALLDRYGAQGDPEALHRRKIEIMQALLRRNTPPVPGIHALVERADRWGLRLAVGSSSDDSVVETVLSRLGLRAFFTAVVTGDAVSRGKPAPDIFLLAASRLRLPPEGCVVVEDSKAGVEASVRAGMACIGFRNPRSGGQDLSAARRTVESLHEIDEALLRDLLARTR